jgi:hypothetical protein
VDVPLDPARDDLAVAAVAFGMVDQRRDQQRLALHQAEHGEVSLEFRQFMGARC